MTDIFLSYASSERERLRPLVEALEAQGWNIWWDKRFLSGNHIEDIITAKLDEARCVIVAWTKLSANSDWVAGEADHAKEAGKLLPIRLEGKRDVPLNFRSLYTEDFSKWSGDRNAPEFIHLCDAIREKLGSPPQPVSAHSTEVSQQIGAPAQRRRWLIPAILAVAVCIALVAGSLYVGAQREAQRAFITAVQTALCFPDANGVANEATLAAVRDYLLGLRRPMPAKIDLTSAELRPLLQSAIDDVGSCTSAGFRTAYEVGSFGVPATQSSARIMGFQKKLGAVLTGKNSALSIVPTGKFDQQTRHGIAEFRRMSGTVEIEVDAQLYRLILSSY